MNLPQIVYLQTLTACNGHCRYCPFDDVYENISQQEMSFEVFVEILSWLKSNGYQGRIGFVLHYEPTLDERLPGWIKYAREFLPGVSFEIATNGIIKDAEILKLVNVVDLILAGSKNIATSRAGNVRLCPEIMQRGRLAQPPCQVPVATMCISVNGDVLLCCQDWRHEAIVGTYENLTKARESQLLYAEKVARLELEICRDCMDGKTAEEVGNRLGRRFIEPKEEEKPEIEKIEEIKPKRKTKQKCESL